MSVFLPDCLGGSASFEIIFWCAVAGLAGSDVGL